MPQTTFSAPINASFETIWNVLLDKVENPTRYVSAIREARVLERTDNQVLREVKTERLTFTEQVTLDKAAREITFAILDHPLFTGNTYNRVIMPGERGDRYSDDPVLVYSLDWLPSNADASKVPDAELASLIRSATLATKNMAEQKKTNGFPSPIFPSEKLPGERTELIKRMFAAGESMNVENFVKFYTEDALYQFSNFPIAYGPQGIRDASGDFLKVVAAVYHNIKSIWENGDTLICEMEVTYTRKDGRIFTLPCCDTIRLNGDLVQELRIYMDITPVFT
jgi:SnoaL-like domain/Domain of unknown function (DUF1857)